MKKYHGNESNAGHSEAHIYMDFAMSALQRESIDPYSNRGRHFYTVIKRLENLMDQLKELDDVGDYSGWYQRDGAEDPMDFH